MKLISSKVMIAVLQNDFGIQTEDYVFRYNDWIEDAIKEMDLQFLLLNKIEKLKKDNNVFKLPCSVGEIDSFLIKNCSGYTFIPTKYLDLPCKCKADYDNSDYFIKFINANTVQSNYNGDIYVAYTTYKKDEDGNFLIPDNPKVKTAIAYYIIYKLALAGYKHKTLSLENVYQLWEKHYPRASNDVNWFNKQEYREFTDMWTDLYNENI